ncbi:MAG: hypothetical protein HY245_00785 [Rhizobiales bacterium]|nr:hypothetical protein [Hyphomicrobiales bacterium]MBI3671972.1 hypothetical protein [Hyphomicrobiales bacterium]
MSRLPISRMHSPSAGSVARGHPRSAWRGTASCPAQSALRCCEGSPKAPRPRRAELLARLEKVRERGYALDLEEADIGVRGVGVAGGRARMAGSPHQFLIAAAEGFDRTPAVVGKAVAGGGEADRENLVGDAARVRAILVHGCSIASPNMGGDGSYAEPPLFSDAGKYRR